MTAESELGAAWWHSPSWVIVCLTSGVALCETFERATARRAAQNDAVRVVPIRAWLAEVNEAAKGA